jgi:hypothetical protein
MMCEFPECEREATTVLEADGRVDAATPCCEPCARGFMAGWNKMKRDEAELRARDVPERMLSRILCERVERGEYNVR